MEKLIVVKSNKLIRASYRLTLNEQRLLLLGISKLDSIKANNNENIVRISAEEFVQIYNIHPKTAYREIKKAAKDFAKRYIVLPVPTENDPGREVIFNWMHETILNPRTGVVELCFHNRMIPYLTQLKSQFTQYRLQEIAKFKSIYGIRFYEFLIQWKSKTIFKISINELKKCFQLNSQQYDRFYNFKKRCIEPAIKDINDFSNYSIEDISYIKEGKIITALSFNFCQKGKLSEKKQQESFEKMNKFLNSTNPIVNSQKKMRQPNDITYDELAKNLNMFLKSTSDTVIYSEESQSLLS